jgi:hypothetical protein
MARCCQRDGGGQGVTASSGRFVPRATVSSVTAVGGAGRVPAFGFSVAGSGKQLRTGKIIQGTTFKLLRGLITESCALP